MKSELEILKQALKEYLKVRRELGEQARTGDYSKYYNFRDGLCHYMMRGYGINSNIHTPNLDIEFIKARNGAPYTKLIAEPGELTPRIKLLRKVIRKIEKMQE